MCLMLGLSACVYLPLRFFFRISELLSTWRSNIVTKDRFHKIFVEVNKADKSREGSWVELEPKLEISRAHMLTLRTVPTNSKLFLRGLLTMREKQILTSLIEIQKQNWG